MTSAKAAVAPTTMLAIGLVFILLATFSVVQTQSVTVSPVQADLSSLFETKSGQMTLQAPPYCGRFDIFCFVIFILRTVLGRLVGIFGGFGGFFPGSTFTGTGGAALSGASTCAAGRAGRDCRQAERKEARAARRAARR
jgi:hypothetical protein